MGLRGRERGRVAHDAPRAEHGDGLHRRARVREPGHLRRDAARHRRGRHRPDLRADHHREAVRRDQLLRGRGRRRREQRQGSQDPVRHLRAGVRGGERGPESSAPAPARRRLHDPRRLRDRAGPGDHRRVRDRRAPRAEGDRDGGGHRPHRAGLEGDGPRPRRAGAPRRSGCRDRLLEREADRERARPAGSRHGVPGGARERRLEADLRDATRRQRLGGVRGHGRGLRGYVRRRPAPGGDGQRHPRHDEDPRAPRVAGAQGGRLGQPAVEPGPHPARAEAPRTWPRGRPAGDPLGDGVGQPDPREGVVARRRPAGRDQRRAGEPRRAGAEPDVGRAERTGRRARVGAGGPPAEQRLRRDRGLEGLCRRMGDAAGDSSRRRGASASSPTPSSGATPGRSSRR